MHVIFRHIQIKQFLRYRRNKFRRMCPRKRPSIQVTQCYLVTQPQYRQSHSQKVRQPDRRTVGQTESRTVRQYDSQTVGQSDSPTVRQSDSPTVRQSDSPTVRQSDGLTVGQSDGRRRVPQLVSRIQLVTVSYLHNYTVSQKQSLNLSVSQSGK